MARTQKRRSADTPVANQRSQPRRERILVVEDQDDVRGLLVTALRIDGHDVDEAPNAHEGLLRLESGLTPTLVKRYPAPRMWLIGNLRETEIVADILRGCGVDAKA
jgi:two-component system, cell cycle response regulator CpdR